MIHKEHGRYVVRAKSTGKKLGTHPTRAAALAQLRAIEASKHRTAVNAIAKKRKKTKGY